MFGVIIAATLGAAQVVHPVFPPQYRTNQVDDLKASVVTAMAMSPRELYAFVPAASGIFFCGCPNCDGGTQDNAVAWEPGMGDRVKCKHCGMEFPNETYPNNHEKEIIAPSGVRQLYRWHENEEGRQFFFEAAAWYRRWGWTRDMALRLANLYTHTGDNAYGDRAAAIVGRYAQVYPDYAIRFDYPFQPVRFWPADQKWPYEGISPFRGAKFYWWGYGDIPTKLARAYDLLAPGDAFERQADLLGDDIRERIEHDLIRMGYEFTAANRDDYGNMSPSMYTDMVVAGRIIGAPEMVHEAVDRFGKLIAKQFFFDGWWRECAPSYHWQTVGNLERVADAAKGYSDPPDWPEPRLDNLDLAAQVPMLRRAFEVGNEGCLPDGRLIPMNDTWWSSKRKPLDASPCRLWPAMGHAVLGAGTGLNQFQAHINWNAAYGHTHMDSGAIILFAFGKELLSDIGYTHTRYRNWTINSASHNMVVVDQRSQQLRHGDPKMTGNVLFFDDTHPNVHLIDVDVQPAYPDCTVYRRRLVHVHAGEGRDYVVDLFDVEGGTVHDYFLHGSANEEGALETSVPLDRTVASLTPEWGGTALPTGENCCDTSGEKYHAYVFLRTIRTGACDGPWTATWRYGEIGLHSHLFAEPETTVYRFQAPSIRGAGEDDARLDDHLLDGILERHTGGTSRFRAVHVPFQGQPWVSGVRYDNGVFTVNYGDVEDVIRWEDARVTVASTAGWRYDSGTPVNGAISAVTRDGGFALHADRPVPAARYVRLDFGGHRTMVYPVETTADNRFILAGDPGFTYNSNAAKSAFLYHPHETLLGPLTWTAWQ